MLAGEVCSQSEQDNKSTACMGAIVAVNAIESGNMRRRSGMRQRDANVSGAHAIAHKDNNRFPQAALN